MQLVNEFVVPRGIDETWAVLTDVERIAPAMPGAELTGVEDGKYNGKVKVKVGPVTAAYAGVASFRELDKANHHMVLDAQGKESSGRGRAAALVSADLSSNTPAETKVTVTTDLTISGPLAQFGRGAIAEVSTRLLNQFVANLKEMVLTDAPDAPAEGAVADPGPDAGLPSLDNVRPGIVRDGTASPDHGSVGPAAESPTPQVATPTVANSSGAEASVPKAAPAPAAEVNLLKVAAWPILKRVVPLLVVIAVIIILIVWLA